MSSLDAGSTVRGVSAVERVEQLIVREVMVVRQMKADSLTVVLRPDDRTEMVLQLSRKDGQLEAFVRCEPKAYEAFHRNWGQLQESMLQHQVQLLPLKQTPVAQYQASTENFTEQGGSGSEFSGRSSQREGDGGERERREVRTTAVDEPDRVLRRAGGAERLRRGGGVSGWESWA
jgi:flagellar hook-length control protein FliK